MDKNDGVGGKSNKYKVEKSETTEDDGKVYKICLVETFNFSVINKVLA